MLDAAPRSGNGTPAPSRAATASVPAAIAAAASQPAARAPVHPNKASRLNTAMFAIAILSLLGYAWSVRLERHITAESGLGYALGITGGTMLLVVLLYPFRKRQKSWRVLGKVPAWFRLHMFLGILGPTLIVLHSNFRLSAINSAVAMMAMLTVVTSGLVGRFLYAKLHVGLYGQKAEMTELYRDAHALLAGFGADITNAQSLMNRLREAEAAIFERTLSPWSSFTLILGMKFKRRRQYRSLLAEAKALLAATANRDGWRAQDLQARQALAGQQLREFQSALRKAAGLRFYERLFSVWHHLHLPLFILLIVAAVVHIFAVHLY